MDCTCGFIVTLFKNIYLVLAVLGLCCCEGFSLVVESRGYSLVVVARLLTAVSSFDAEQSRGLSGFSSCGVWTQ